MSDSQWTLNYWIRDQPLASFRTIEVAPHTKVYKIQELIIQAAVSYQNDRLLIQNIYKVPDDAQVIDDDFLVDNLGKLSMSALGKPLRSTQALSSVFATLPPEMQLHLIIDVPSLDIACWLRGEEINRSFRVKSSTHDKVGNLKHAVYQALALKDISESQLRLYKITASDELAKVLSEMGSGQFLTMPVKELKNYFDDIPFANCPRVVVEVREDKPVAFLGVGANPITEKRDKFLRDRLKASHSNSGTPVSFMELQTGDTIIPCGRPRYPPEIYEEVIPSELLHPALGQFAEDCRSTICATCDDNFLAQEISDVMSDIYGEETTRVDKILAALRRYKINLGIGVRVSSAKYTIDGGVSANGHVCVIAKFKNETVGNKSDAYFEAIEYYLESTRSAALEYVTSPLPCIIATLSGPSLVFAVATWNLRPAVQVFSSIVLNFHPGDKWNHSNVARHFTALRKAIRSLSQYYNGLQDTRSQRPKSIPLAPQLFPHKTSYVSLQGGGTIEFQYEKQVMASKRIFFGTDGESKRRICIKFSRRYSKDAHECLASMGRAPVLRGFEKIPGDWFMSVSDALDGFETLAHPNNYGNLPSSFFDSIAATLDEFHDKGFVHGDLRDVNIMVSPTDKTDFKIIDFDWAGRLGEAVYPILVDTVNVRRPEDDLDGKVILREHDDFMLEDMRNVLCKD